jgi:hypothetical protein
MSILLAIGYVAIGVALSAALVVVLAVLTKPRAL